MLQAINAVHTFSIVHHTVYFSALVLLALVVIPGWYRLGKLQVAVSNVPQSSPVRQRFVFYRRSTSIALQIANLLILGSIQSSHDTIAATIAVKVT